MSHWFLLWLVIAVLNILRHFVFPRRGRRSTRAYERYRQILRDVVAQRGGYLQEAGRNSLLYTSHTGLQQVELRFDHQTRIILHARTWFDFQVTFTPIHPLPYAFMGELYSPQSRVEPFFISSPKAAARILAKPGAKALLEKLGQDGFSIRFGSDGITASRSIRRRSTTEFEITDWMRKLDDLITICTAVETGKIHPVESDQYCGYCKEQINQTDGIIYCASCSTPHHKECFQLNGKCTVFGCGSVRSTDEPILETVMSR